MERKLCALSDDEFKIRLAEIFELLLKESSQQLAPRFSKDSILLDLQAPKQMGGSK